MNKKILLFGIVFLCLISFVSADKFSLIENSLESSLDSYIYYNNFTIGTSAEKGTFSETQSSSIDSSTYSCSTGDNAIKFTPTYYELTGYQYLGFIYISSSGSHYPRMSDNDDNTDVCLYEIGETEFKFKVSGSFSSFSPVVTLANAQDKFITMNKDGTNSKCNYIIYYPENLTIYASSYNNTWGGSGDNLRGGIYMASAGLNIDEVRMWNNTYNDGITIPFYSYTPPAPNEFQVTTKDIYDSSLINSTITISNSTLLNTSNATNGVITFYNLNGLINITINATNYETKYFLNYNVSNDLVANLTYYKARYLIENKFKDFETNETIINFTMNFYYSNNDTLETSVSTNLGNLSVELSWNNYFYAIIDALGYELINVTLNTTMDFTQQNEVYFYPENSVRINIRDEVSSSLIDSQSVSIQLSSDTGLLDYVTNNGTILIKDLIPDTYSVRFNTSGYSVRIYSIVVSNRSYQTLNSYLSTEETKTTFTIKDKSSLDTISNVLLTMYRFYNDSWQPIEAKYSDVTGRVQVTYTDDIHYKFYLAKSGYQDFIFYLNPVLFSEYTIQMERISQINDSSDLSHTSILINPRFFTEGNNTLSFIIQNPYGELISYGYNLTYPSGVTYNSGSNLLGSDLSSTFTITNPNFNDVVKIDYFYSSSVSGVKTFSVSYPIEISNNSTMKNYNNDPTFGFGLLERTLIMVLLGIIIVGIATLFGQTLGGVLVMYIAWGFFVYTKFISIWLVIISIIIGIILLSLRGER